LENQRKKRHLLSRPTRNHRRPREVGGGRTKVDEKDTKSYEWPEAKKRPRQTRRKQNQKARERGT